MPSKWGRYSKPVGDVRTRLLSRSKQEDRGYETPCLIFDGEKDSEGYGRIKNKGKYVQAHWVLIGRPQKGYEIDHLCHQRDCVRPSHLEVVTRQENTLRRGDTGRSKRATVEERAAAEALLAMGKSLKDVADATGLSRRTIGRIRDGQGRRNRSSE